MSGLTISEQDVIDVSEGRMKLLPRDEGGSMLLSYDGKAYRLTPVTGNYTLPMGAAPGEGAAAETPPTGTQ